MKGFIQAMVFQVDISGSYTLEPNPSTGMHNWGVSLYLTEDERISPDDKKVLPIQSVRHG